MQSLYNQIEQIAQSLRQAGKTPSLALVRARLGPGIAAAELMTVYQRWHSTQGSLSHETPPVSTGPLQQPTAISADDFARLEAKIDHILQLLQAGQPAQSQGSDVRR